MNNVLLLFLMIIVALSCPVYAVDVTIPVANFTGNLTTGAVPLTVTFADTSTGNPTGWAWYFGDETYTAPWTQLNTSAGWTRRTEHSSVAMPDGSIVLMGGITPSGGYMNDVWRSTDNGATWMLVNASAGWIERVRHSSVAMPDGSIVLMGGWWYSDNQANDVWRSTDNGATWMLVNASAGWTARESHTSVAMPDGSIVLMGGFDNFDGWKNDVWRSTDNGATWTLVNASAGWTPREYHSSVAMPDGSIMLMGGIDYNLPTYKNDVWGSTDNGATWIQKTASAEWLERGGHTSVAMPDGSIVLMGGITPSGGYMNDVWRSTDNGATWMLVNASAGWIGRWSHTSVAMPDGSIVLMGGLYGGSIFFNDTWRLNPTGSSAQSPSHTYTIPGIYNVALQVYNTDGYNSTRKTGYINVTPSGVPDASFTVIPSSGIAPLIVQFNDTSANFPSAWSWSFRNMAPGNNTQIWFSDVHNPKWTFGAGNYSIVLNASNSAGYNLSTQVTFINVSARPVVTNVTSKIGIFRSTTGIWSLDSNGNNAWEVSDTSLSWGLPGDIPVIGDWNGDGKDDIGIFRPSSSMWSLDSNGNSAWEVSDTTLSWGLPADIPVIGDWNGDKKDEIGVYNAGNWYLDYDGTGVWSAGDKNYGFGTTGWIPVIGKWS